MIAEKPVPSRLRLFSLLALLTSLLALAPGCGGPESHYIASAVVGEIKVLGHSVSIDEALDNTDMPVEQHDKLLWVRNVRDYAQNQLGLDVGQSYLYYYDTGDGPAIYNLSASPKDALDPLSWKFPFTGESEYRGYFNRDEALAYAQQLRDAGYDVVVYGAMAYSTGGHFRDPLYSCLLTLDYPTLSATVIHELTHNTVFCMGNSEYNESTAEFVGNTGGLQYLKSVAGEDSDLYRQAISQDDDEALVTQFLIEVYNDLSTFYARADLTSQQKIDQREQVFQAARDRFQTDVLPKFHDPDRYKGWGNVPANNAWILLNRRYNRSTDVFQKVLDGCNQNLTAAVQVFRQAADAPDPFQFLANWPNP